MRRFQTVTRNLFVTTFKKAHWLDDANVKENLDLGGVASASCYLPESLGILL